MKKLGTTARTILSYLTVAGPTRRKVLLASVKPAGKSTNWGNSYFLPTFESGNGARSSLLAKGYILRVGRGLYTITPKGMGALAQYGPSLPPTGAHGRGGKRPPEAPADGVKRWGGGP